MKPPSVWSRLLGILQPRHAPPPAPADELLIATPSRVRSTLDEVSRLRRAIAVQAADGRFVGSGMLITDSTQGLEVQLRGGSAASQGPWPWPLNATASGPQGMLLFTLGEGRVTAAGRLAAPWPDQLIRVQSRRHFRLHVLSGTRQRAWLRRGGVEPWLRVRNLSEEGVCVEAGNAGWPGPDPVCAAELRLDDEVLAVPAMEVVHLRTDPLGRPAWVGARLAGMGEEQRRVLRRWIATVQADCPAAPGDQA